MLSNPVHVLRKCRVALGLVVACALLAPASALAAPFTINGSSGVLSANLTVTTSGSNLIMTLTNTSLGDPSAPSDVLTAVFFDIAGVTLTPVSAQICATCSMTYGGKTDPNRSVGGEWAYLNSPGLAYTASNGISATGLGLFGPGNLFGGTNLNGPVSPNGISYGITTRTDSTANNNGGLANEPLIRESDIYTFSVIAVGFIQSQRRAK